MQAAAAAAGAAVADVVGREAYRRATTLADHGRRRVRDWWEGDGEQPSGKKQKTITAGKTMPRRFRPRQFTNFHMWNCVEKKYVDSETTAATTATSGKFYSLIAQPPAADVTATYPVSCRIPQGNTAETRIGQKIFLHDTHIRCTMDNSNASTACGFVRVIIFIDKQSNGTLPELGEILDGGDFINAFRNLDNTKRFVFLKDKVYSVGNTGGTSSNALGGCVKWRFNKQWKVPLRVNYTGANTDGESDGVQDNNVWMLVIGSDALVTYNVSTRTRFTD